MWVPSRALCRPSRSPADMGLPAAALAFALRSSGNVKRNAGNPAGSESDPHGIVAFDDQSVWFAGR